MIFKAFSVFDTKSGIFSPPFFLTTAGEAIRSFGDLVTDPQSRISKHPSDYILYEVGSFDDQKALFVSPPTPHHLGSGSDFVPLLPVRPLSVEPVINGMEVVK